MMKKEKYFQIVFLLFGLISSAQTDEDVVRYTNLGIGGTSRFIGLSGAMGALGGDMSCASYNPAGIGISLKSDLNFSFGMHFANTITDFNSSTQKKLSPALNFNFLGLGGTSIDKKNPENRYYFMIGYNQLQNYNQSIFIKGRPTRGKSMTLDMLDYAKGKAPKNLDGLYEGAAYYVYLLDLLDTLNYNTYYSYIDTSKSFLQQKKINTSGRVNELTFSYAYTFDETVYLGVTLGIPFLKFSYQSDYAEIDDRNEMYIVKNPNNTYSSSYSYPVKYYSGLGGIKDFHYQTTYTTTATGINIKLGSIWRVNDYFRVGFYYHSLTWFKAKDIYYYRFETNWDEGQRIKVSVPDGGGLYNYNIRTPSKLGIAISSIVQNKMSINADYEIVDYRKGLLSSSDVGVFDNANKALKEKYAMTGNLRCGIELNTKPIIFRMGWASYGSPFGNQISGNYVRNSFSFGFGFKTTYFYYDFAFVKSFIGKQEYYMYNPKYCDVTNIQLNLTQVIFTIGLIGKRYDDDIDYEKYNQPKPNNPPAPSRNDEPFKPKIPY